MTLRVIRATACALAGACGRIIDARHVLRERGCALNIQTCSQKAPVSPQAQGAVGQCEVTGYCESAQTVATSSQQLSQSLARPPARLWARPRSRRLLARPVRAHSPPGLRAGAHGLVPRLPTKL